MQLCKVEMTIAQKRHDMVFEVDAVEFFLQTKACSVSASWKESIENGDIPHLVVGEGIGSGLVAMISPAILIFVLGDA